MGHRGRGGGRICINGEFLLKDRLGREGEGKDIGVFSSQDL